MEHNTTTLGFRKKEKKTIFVMSILSNYETIEWLILKMVHFKISWTITENIALLRINKFWVKAGLSRK